MMAFDKNKDGVLTKDEITDERLMKLFERADKNNDGKVTREELEALVKAEAPMGGGRGPGGPGGGPGGPGGRRGPPMPGQIMPDFLAEQIKLSDDQKKKFTDLQKELDGKIEKILTDEQKKMMKEMKERGPGGPGGPGGGPGGPGGRGPGGPGGEGNR